MWNNGPAWTQIFLIKNISNPGSGLPEIIFFKSNKLHNSLAQRSFKEFLLSYSRSCNVIRHQRFPKPGPPWLPQIHISPKFSHIFVFDSLQNLIVEVPLKFNCQISFTIRFKHFLYFSISKVPLHFDPKDSFTLLFLSFLYISIFKFWRESKTKMWENFGEMWIWGNQGGPGLGNRWWRITLHDLE